MTASASPPSGRRLGPGEISEVALPGIGHRYDLHADEGDLSVILHHTGRRDLYVLDEGRRRTSVALSDAQARTLGAILGGAYFKPSAIEEIEAVIDDLLIDWVTLDEGSPGVGRSIADLAVRRETRMTIAAILRDHEPIVAPEPDEVLRGGDRLVVIGRPDDLPGFRRHVVRTGHG